MKYFDLTNDGNCNIFTDTAFRRQQIILNGQQCVDKVASPGANLCNANLEIVDSITNIVHNSTTPRGEIIGILYGLELGYRNARPGQVINIYSDSKASVKGVRDWIFGWINNQRNGFLRGYNSLIENQVYFLGIVYTVLRHNIPVRFYHVRSHMDYMKYKDRTEFARSFEEENNLNTFISDMFLTYLIRGNDLIDHTVKSVLYNTDIQQSAEYWNNNPIAGVPLDITMVANTPEFVQSLDMKRYGELIGVL